jgi:hypothetical protein
MTSKRLISGAVLAGVLSAIPAYAQEARARRDPGGDRGGRTEQRSSGDRGGDRGGERRYAAPRHPGGGSYTGPRVEQRRQEAPRQYTAPRQDSRRYEAARRYDNRSDNRRYDAPRRYDNNSNRRYDNARRYDAPRRYEAPRAYQYDRRTYARPYGSNRGYVAPRRDPYYRSARPFYGYRGVYGYGSNYRRTRIVTVVPWRPYRYRPRYSIGVYYGAGGVYNYGYTPSYYYDPLPNGVYGGVRITNAPHEAQVFADGYYVGIVDDFDGIFQHVNLEAGEHRIEVRTPGYEPISFDVYVQAGRTITLRADAYDDGYADSDY